MTVDGKIVDGEKMPGDAVMSYLQNYYKGEVTIIEKRP